MAKSNAVWGIDIGQSSLKALRCVKGADDTIVAEGYDYIEYPKLLSAADASPVEIVQEALEQFLSRNDVVGDKVAISVPGQAGLSRFFKPPPVDAKKLTSLVEFEVSQQIPFPIQDVIWDWEQLGGSKDDEGRIADAEIGIFAMKRDAVFRALQPFDDAGVEVDIVQLSPLSIFNVVCKDLIDELPGPEEFDPEDPPESTVVLSMGTDTTDLIVTNGLKLWMRNIPIGGNHFTKQLSREMKLTQAKAEHLKRNAKMAENPKAVFQAMRPVFNDLVNEVQRSLTFFQGMDKLASFSELVLLGNAAKLPGMTQFLKKQLEIDVKRARDFEHLSGEEVISQSTFANNSLTFAPCYGLCLQGLRKSRLKTNLLPQEIVMERVVRAKKPWVLASVSLLLLGCCLGLFYKTLAANQVSETFEDDKGVTWKKAMNDADNQTRISSGFVANDTKQKELLEKFNVIAKELSSATEQRGTWIEVNSAIYQAMPRDSKIQLALKESGEDSIDPKDFPFAGREEIYIDHLETAFFKDLGVWHGEISDIYDKQIGKEKAPVDPDSFVEEPTDGSASPLASQPGWVIELQGHHFHNEDALNAEGAYVQRTLMKNLREGVVKLPDGEFTYGDLGISFPTVTRTPDGSSKYYVRLATADDNQNAMGNQRNSGGFLSSRERRSKPNQLSGSNNGLSDGIGFSGGLGDGMGDSGEHQFTDDENVFETKVFTFVVQMAWQPRTKTERLEARRVRVDAEKKEREAAEQAAADAAANEGV